MNHLPNRGNDHSGRRKKVHLNTALGLLLAGAAVFAFDSLPAVAAEKQAIRQVPPGVQLFGETALPSEETRTIRITPQIKAVSVHSGEVIRFDFGARSATWRFATRPGNVAVELGTLFPEIPESRGVWVHQNGSNDFAGH